jgi:hypothetical protein
VQRKLALRVAAQRQQRCCARAAQCCTRLPVRLARAELAEARGADEALLGRRPAAHLQGGGGEPRCTGCSSHASSDAPRRRTPAAWPPRSTAPGAPARPAAATRRPALAASRPAHTCRARGTSSRPAGACARMRAPVLQLRCAVVVRGARCGIRQDLRSPCVASAASQHGGVRMHAATAARTSKAARTAAKVAASPPFLSGWCTRAAARNAARTSAALAARDRPSRW